MRKFEPDAVEVIQLGIVACRSDIVCSCFCLANPNCIESFSALLSQLKEASLINELMDLKEALSPARILCRREDRCRYQFILYSVLLIPIVYERLLVVMDLDVESFT